MHTIITFALVTTEVDVTATSENKLHNPSNLHRWNLSVLGFFFVVDVSILPWMILFRRGCFYFAVDVSISPWTVMHVSICTTELLHSVMTFMPIVTCSGKRPTLLSGIHIPNYSGEAMTD